MMITNGPYNAQQQRAMAMTNMEKRKRKLEARRDRHIDIFRDNKAMRLMRYAIEHGETTLIDLKREQHRLGGAQGNIMHSIAQYVQSARFDAAPLLKKGGKKGRTFAMYWIGSSGSTFEERALNWLQRLSNEQLEESHCRCEVDFVEAGRVGDALFVAALDGSETAEAREKMLALRESTVDEVRALAWLKIVKYEIARRTLSV